MSTTSEPTMQSNANLLREEAHRLGFDFVGIAKAQPLNEEARLLEQWLQKGLHGTMAYMEQHFDLRIDPTKLVPEARSVVMLAYNYYTTKQQKDETAPRLSKYAFGEDYHKVIKRKLKQLLAFLRERIGQVQGRCFVDSAPVMERDWARHAGLGWTGKHTLLINPKRGSYFFLATLIIDLPLVTDAPMKDYCGTCRRCIEACPTQAISPKGYLLDATKCISYLTIELKGDIPDVFQGKMDNWMFGCDVCQSVCPWNRFSKQHQEPAFEPSDDLLNMTRRNWEDISAEVFDKLFERSAVKRTKYEGLRRNLHFIQPSKTTQIS